jgi:hypothetical protein
LVLARCWSRMIAARISAMVKIPFAWRVASGHRRDVTHEPSAQPACSEERRRSA